MLVWRTAFALIAALFLPMASAFGQDSPAERDSLRTQIYTTLRAFYFNLAHRDWDAMTASILPAKIVAHRPAPEALVLLQEEANGRAGCSSESTVIIERAAITVDGDWAQVSVPRCAVASRGADEFRLVRFSGRWRVVYIDLIEESLDVSAGK